MRMKVYYFLLAIGLLTWSCKEDVKNELDTMTEVTSDTIISQVSKEVIDQSNDAKVRQSVMTKIMVTPELSRFASTLVSANLTNMLSTDEGPFTVFSPDTTAFAAISEGTMNTILNQNNRAQLAATLKKHILREEISSADMVQALRSADTLRYKTVAGETLKIVKQGDVIFVIDASGIKASIGESDIKGNNGVVHIIDQVLGLN